MGMSTSVRRVIRIAAVLAGGCLAAHRVEAQSREAVAGCYSFNKSIFSWFTYERWSETALHGETGLIELTSEPVTRSTVGAAWRVRVPSLLDAEESARWDERSYWRRIGLDSLEISWFNGLFGPLARMRIAGDSLVGAQHYRSDVDPFAAPRWSPVMAHRRRCVDSRRRVERRFEEIGAVGQVEPDASIDQREVPE